MLSELESRNTEFSLPACDDPPSTEIGVIVMGLPATYLLAGLGATVLADDPVRVTLLVDHLRHSGSATLSLDHLMAAGVNQWRAAEPVLASAGPKAYHPLRPAWTRAHEEVLRYGLAANPAAAIYLTACWLRAPEISQYVAQRDAGGGDSDALPEVAAR